MYQRRSRMNGRQQGKLLEHFVADTTARAAALLIGVQANTAIYLYQRVRQLIASKLPSYELSGEVEADECVGIAHILSLSCCIVLFHA